MNYEEILNDEWEKFKINQKYPNILILGRENAGKTSLLNTVFGIKLTNITSTKDDFKKYIGSKNNHSINIIDSKGFNLFDNTEDYYKKVLTEIELYKKTKNIDDQVHLIWYCIPITEGIEVTDLEILNLLLANKNIEEKLCVILTKCDTDNENLSITKNLKDYIEHEFSNRFSIYRVSDKSYVTLDIDNLIHDSANLLDNDNLRENFISSQKENLKLKRKEAYKVIAVACTSAVAVGATPIPLSDASLLVPIQALMVTRIVNIYNMSNLTNFSNTLASNIVITQIGKTIVGSVFKFIPGIGSIVGGAIQATVATSITYALGETISKICYDACIKILDGEKVDVDKLFDMNTVLSLFNIFYEKRKK